MVVGSRLSFILFFLFLFLLQRADVSVLKQRCLCIGRSFAVHQAGEGMGVLFAHLSAHRCPFPVDWGAPLRPYTSVEISLPSLFTVCVSHSQRHHWPMFLIGRYCQGSMGSSMLVMLSVPCGGHWFLIFPYKISIGNGPIPKLHLWPTTSVLAFKMCFMDRNYSK